MENVYGGQTGNVILTRLFRKAELSWAVFAFSGAVSPIVDLMFISLFIGSEGVTVMGYVSPLIMLSALVGSYIICGARNEVSTLLGAGKIDEANSVFSASVFLGGGLSLITAVAVGIFCSGVSVILGVRDPQILEMTKLYISGNIIGLPFFSLIQILRAYLQMEGQYHRVSMISILITVIDIAADAFVVFVLHGGIFGLALATSVGYIIPFFVGAEFFMRKKHNSVFRLSHKGLNLKICCKIMHLGSPAAVIKGSNAVGGILINNMLTALNIRYLVAAYGVFAQITVFVSSSWYAPADTLHAFAGIFIGEEDRNSLKEVQKISLLHALLWTSIVTALMFVFAVPLTWIFLKSNDPEALRMSVECIRVSCFSLPFHAIVYNFNNYLMAVKRLRFCNFYSFLIECGNIVPITFLMLQLINYPGAWVSKVVNMLLLSAIAWFYISKNNVEGGGIETKCFSCLTVLDSLPIMKFQSRQILPMRLSTFHVLQCLSRWSMELT